MDWGRHAQAEHRLLHSNHLLPQGNAGLVGTLFSIPFRNLPISKHWTFEINKNPTLPQKTRVGYIQDQELPFWELFRVYTPFSLSYPRALPLLSPRQATSNSKRKRQGLTMELLKATGGCEISQRPPDLCRQWPWMRARALWLLRGWDPPWPLIVAGPWSLRAGKDKHRYWVHSSLSESSSSGVSSRLAAGKEPRYCASHTLARSWLGRCQTLGVELRVGSWLPQLVKEGCN